MLGNILSHTGKPGWLPREFHNLGIVGGYAQLVVFVALKLASIRSHRNVTYYSMRGGINSKPIAE